MHRKVTEYEICSNVTPLFDAVRNNNVEQVQESLSYAGIYDSMGMTAIMHAARHNYLDIVKVLEPLEGHLEERDGKTVLMHATECGALEVSQYILSFQGYIKSDKLPGNCLKNAMLAGEVQCAELFTRTRKTYLRSHP